MQEDEVIWNSQVLDKPYFNLAVAMDHLTLGAKYKNGGDFQSQYKTAIVGPTYPIPSGTSNLKTITIDSIRHFFLNYG